MKKESQKTQRCGIFLYICAAKDAFMPKYSIIIPVFNRPDEVDELLTSLEAQGSNGAGKRDVPAFEVIVVEDGSTTTCEAA